MTIIGLDLGNFFSFPSYIEGMDEIKRTGGVEHELLRLGEGEEGIPSIFAKERLGGQDREFVGYEARRITGPSNQMTLLKRSIRDNVVSTKIGTKDTGEYEVRIDYAIQQLVAYVMKIANKRLLDDGLSDEPTNKVALACPVTFGPFEKERFIEIIEHTKLENGSDVEVVGLIEEPAAAALEYLAVRGNQGGAAQTVLVYDLGAGTFDVSILTAWPNGKQDDRGIVRYYEIIDKAGLESLGGNEFTEVLRHIAARKMGLGEAYPTDPMVLDSFLRETENAKIALSTSAEVFPHILRPGGRGYYDLCITQDEFERESRDLLTSTLDEVQKLLERHRGLRIDCIVLTGGASQMPMVLRAFKEDSDEIKVAHYKPSSAISFGAARYYTPYDPDGAEAVIRPVAHDFGISFHEPNKDRRWIYVFIHEGETLPVEPEFTESRSRRDGQTSSLFQVYEAKVSNPDTDEIERDWTKIGELELSHPACEKGTPFYSRLRLDDLGVLHAEAKSVIDSGPVAHRVIREGV